MIIVGCGSTGIKVAEWLMASGAEVTMIDNDSEKQRFVDNLFGSICLLYTSPSPRDRG